ncbi:MAG: hypothetical protein Q4D41_06990 [Prevotellaceae bacterium]|nr:hypothetical protein [Prevotellaceae bacterium]
MEQTDITMINLNKNCITISLPYNNYTMEFFTMNNKYIFRQIVLISIVCLFGSYKTLALTTANDSIEITGNIVCTQDTEKDYRITVSTIQGDSLPSILLFSNTFRTNHFHIKLEQIATPITLSVNALGCRAVCKDLGIVNGKYYIGTLELTNDTTMHLSTVFVTAKRPLVIEHGMKTKYNISGSMLSEAGTLMSLFRRLPNLSVNNGKLNVLDSYGIETVIMLNERELRDPNVLDVLNAKDVKSIEIDRNPEILYKGKIVIKIETVKKINDYIYNDMELTYTQGRKPYGNVGTNIRGKFGKVSMGVSYRYGHDNRMIDDDEFRMMPEDGSELNLIDNMRTVEKENKHNILVNLEYMPNEKINMSLLYNSTFTRQKNYVSTDRSMLTAIGLKNTNLMQNFPIKAYSHSLSLGFTKEIWKGNLTLLADYAVTKNSTDFSTTEQNLATSNYQEVVTKKDSHSHLVNILGKYSFKSQLGIDLNVGLKCNLILVPTNYHFSTEDITVPLVQDVNTMEQSNVLFLDAEKWITKHIQLQAGVSYDFTCQYIKYKENSLDQSIYKQYHNIIPSFSIGYLFAARSFVAFGLSVPFVKPRFEDIIPSAIYKDALLYEQREPNVKATRTYVFSCMWQYNSFFMRALISHSPLFYEHTYERLSSSSFAMKSVIVPFRNQTFSQLTMSYYKLWNRGLFLQATGNFYYRPNFINGKVANQHLTYYPMLTIGYNKHTIYAWTTFSYINETSNGIQWVERTGFNIDAGATVNLLKDKFTIDVTTPNLTRINVPAQYSINGGMKWGVRPVNRDCEFFNITFRYKLFNNDIKLQQQRGNSEELDRIL